MLAQQGFEVGSQQGFEVQRADFGRRVARAEPEEASDEDEVKEGGEGLGGVGVHDPGKRVGFESLELGARAGAIVRGGGAGYDFSEELEQQGEIRFV